MVICLSTNRLGDYNKFQMGTCSTKDPSMNEYKFNFDIPKKESFGELYNASKDFFLRSELVNLFKAQDKKLGSIVLVKQLSKTILKHTIQLEISILQSSTIHSSSS